MAGGSLEKIEGQTSLTLENLEKGMDYRLVATNNVNSLLSAENSFTYGDRIVVYVDYQNGSNYNDGYTPQTPVQNLQTAYSKLSSSGTRNENIIVMMGNYTDTSLSFYNSQTSTTYAKKVTITGKYAGVDYNAVWRFGSNGSSYYYFRYLTEDTTFMYLTLNGGNGYMYLICQGHSFTIGEQVTMDNYTNASSNQGLLGSNAPGFHLFAGWYQYNRTRLPNNNSEIIIKSGSYGRIVLGGTPGTSSGQGQTTSHDFMGSSMDDSFKVSITVDIQNSTTASKYDYDVNLLVGGSACGNNYSVVTENIKSGSVGRLLGGSIGDSATRPSSGGWWGESDWDYPENTFLGTTTINISGGSVNEVYGGCLGRNMNVVGSPNATGNTCDSYFYGTATINITGGTITNNIYGAGAGGVTGYNVNSSDPYKSYGEEFETVVNINISGGTVGGNIYGGGYGYTEYLNANVTAVDGGALYGDSNIVISGSPTINGNIYAAGCGYNLSSKPNIAQMTGKSTITINGTPTINGYVFGAGAGISGYSEMAKLIGDSTININANLYTNAYGGGNIAKTEGNTYININSGNHTAQVYGGGNLGVVDGNSQININGGTSNEIYGGGQSSDVNSSYINLQGGQANVIYGGSNITGTVNTTNITGTSGTANTIFGGNNVGGNCEETNITINGANITDAIYGGGNKVNTNTSNITIKSNQNKIPNIYGGGNEAGVTTTNILLDGGSAENVFGGSNTSGTVETSNIEAKKGTYSNIYGGNNQGGTTNITRLKIDGVSATNVFGGGNKADTPTSNVYLLSGQATNIYGGGNEAGVTNANVNLTSGKSENVFGGSNNSGIVETSNITTETEIDNNLQVTNIYGGNNAGGLTKNPNIKVAGGTIENIFGGGNRAEVENTNINIEKGIIQDIYGGGNAAAVQNDTSVKVTGGSIKNNVYGGGNEGIVQKNTNVLITNGKINGSVYAGGNGTTATVYENANITIDGETVIGTTDSVSPESGCVFGGGKAAVTGTESNNNSQSTVNIVGGTIYGNVYGGANTSKVYGITNTNIGYVAVGNENLQKANILITGTVFGGGEANASGSEVYDFSYISVTKGININIDGDTHDEFAIRGSIFGSGNASSTSGASYVMIKNYGTIDNPQKNISIQRATIVTLDNSAVVLSGATDRTNEYSNVYFTFSRVNHLKLKNNSTVYLNYGANLLQQYSSLLDNNGTEELATVQIDKDTGETSRNVDNRIYMYEGKNLNIATNEQVTAYGMVNGMTFLGLYTNSKNPSTSTGLYNHNFNNSDEITNAGTFSANSYVLGMHKLNHNIEQDGFYTNYNKDGYIKTGYVDVTPEDDTYYIWSVGEQMDVTTFEITMTASKYATLGTYELPLTGFSKENIKFSIAGFSAGLADGISLVDGDTIEPIASDEKIANTVFGLNMKTGKNGWKTKSSTNFYATNGVSSYKGSTAYDADNSPSTPSLTFCFYHSQNLTQKQELGNVRIRFQVLTPIDDLNYEITYMDININLLTALFQDNYYEAAISPGEEFNLFTTTETNITDSSIFSTYYSLLVNEFSDSGIFEEYSTYHRSLVSTDANGLGYVYPENTKITMLDLATNKHYYYVVTSQDEQNNKYVYNLSDFIEMGTTNKNFNETEALNLYYNQQQDLIYEKLIFHVNFKDSNIAQDALNNSLLMELRDSDNQTLIGVLGIQRDTSKYSIYKGKDAVIDVTADLSKDIVYLGQSFNLNVSANFEQQVLNTKTIYDTQYFDNQMGIKISLFDSYGNQLNGDSLIGTTFELDGIKYYTRMDDGSIRIKIAEKVSNVLARIKIDLKNNTTIATGKYKIKVETFGSPDGIYYGIEASDYVEKEVTIINGTYGLKAKIDDNMKIIDKETGKNLNNNKSLIVNLKYTSSLEKPKITVCLQRRNYETIYDLGYETVDLAEYISDSLDTTKTANEYLLTNKPAANINYFYTLKENLKTGTYKLVFKLYDDNTYIGEVYDYFIVK